MQGDPQVIEFLNEQLTGELTAINQYFLHAKMQENWGCTKLAAHTRAESIDEMKHAEMLTDRILFLEGLPNYQRLVPLRIGQTVREQFESDMAIELEAVDAAAPGVAYMRAVGDITSREHLRGDPRRRGAPHRLPRDAAAADRQARRAALPRAARRAAVELSGSRRPVHTPLIASIRPSRMAVSSAAWSRSVWSAYATANDTRASSNASDRPR